MVALGKHGLIVDGFADTGRKYGEVAGYGRGEDNGCREERTID